MIFVFKSHDSAHLYKVILAELLKAIESTRDVALSCLEWIVESAFFNFVDKIVSISVNLV